ncbi:MAG: single-stranded DNA-binding protein [bacterium]
MSRGVNRVILIGNLGADPELRSTQTGLPVCDLRIATSRRWNDKAGEQREETDWHRIVAWDKLASTCHRHLEKGSQVFVEGRLQTRKWTDKEGQDRWSTEVIASSVIFLGSPRRASQGSSEDTTRQW